MRCKVVKQNDSRTGPKFKMTRVGPFQTQITPRPSPGEMLSTLVIDLDKTLIHAVWKFTEDKEDRDNVMFKHVETGDFVIYINHVLVRLIEFARLQGIKIVLWTNANGEYTKEILEATGLNHLFDHKLTIDNAPERKILRCMSDSIIVPPMLIIDDTEEKVDQNSPDEYLVVEDFMGLSEAVLELKYTIVYANMCKD